MQPLQGKTIIKVDEERENNDKRSKYDDESAQETGQVRENLRDELSNNTAPFHREACIE